MWVCAWEYVRGLVHVRVGLELCARGPGAVRAGPFAGGGNPFLRSWALLVAVWAACLDYHLWG